MSLEFFKKRWSKPDARNKYYALSVLRIPSHLLEKSILIYAPPFQFWNLIKMPSDHAKKRAAKKKEMAKGKRKGAKAAEEDPEIQVRARFTSC